MRQMKKYFMTLNATSYCQQWCLQCFHNWLNVHRREARICRETGSEDDTQRQLLHIH